MNNAHLAYLLGCIDPFVDEAEMTEEDLHYFSNSEVNKRKINLLDMMLKPPKEKETINDGKFHWGDEFDEIKQKKLEKKEGI